MGHASHEHVEYPTSPLARTRMKWEHSMLLLTHSHSSELPLLMAHSSPFSNSISALSLRETITLVTFLLSHSNENMLRYRVRSLWLGCNWGWNLSPPDNCLTINTHIASGTPVVEMLGQSMWTSHIITVSVRASITARILICVSANWFSLNNIRMVLHSIACGMASVWIMAGG